MQNNNRQLIMQFEHLDLEYDREQDAIWTAMKYSDRPCMSLPLLDDFKRAQKTVSQMMQSEQSTKLPRYLILRSQEEGVFNLGGDLDLFISLIQQKDRDGLYAYARSCIDIIYNVMSIASSSVTTIALVQGEALGGGFEAALSANVLVAEKSSKFGFPETVFGMFPGMGAYNFLTRRLSPGLAKRVITSGKIYTAPELYDMGVIDVIVPDGHGEEAVYDHIKHQSSRSLGYKALDRIVEHFNPITYDELHDVIDLWVDTALQLSDKNLRLMEYLVHAQKRRWVREQDDQVIRMVG